ncbi:CRISPR-associated endonuclease Cas3'' [Thermoproteus tenax]|uniref:Predicted HD superfamily hydrolase, possible nuclease n=1 Tax=Thermoproteus tenax (strain ATCC 35583 / DSM 2078 / JCM 9277 / NBRC 100435 / Kra 1) TaxID=768679 RepID=G4RMW8_THETK|nr:CRISPR-associated endonuclease Cas3'' [Thermoproteus tenax]CCC80912.1 Predicted HD superfamily hydrolase, possible nuclease [Thermoproteus tenax Kra 1]
MTCLAGPGEPLELHLEEVASCMAARGRWLAPKLARVLGVEEALARDLIVFVGYAHDVGKADRKYKDADRYFPHHEAKSAVAVQKALDSADWRIRRLAVYAVARHHYSFKELQPLGKVTFQPRCKITISWRPETELFNEALNLLFRDAEDDIYDSAVSRDFLEALEGPARYAGMALLGLLSDCDYEVASRNRR